MVNHLEIKTVYGEDASISCGIIVANYLKMGLQISKSNLYNDNTFSPKQKKLLNVSANSLVITGSSKIRYNPNTFIFWKSCLKVRTQRLIRLQREKQGMSIFLPLIFWLLILSPRENGDV